MLDNLFIVESPLQALIAVELSLQFPDQSSGIVYRLCGEGRERNDRQICKVIEKGNFLFVRPLFFGSAATLSYHLRVRRFVIGLGKEFFGSVTTLFFGEFRSQWMHFARMAVAPKKCVLMDDGTAMIVSKKHYIDKGIFYPEVLWRKSNYLKRITKSVIYFGLFKGIEADKPITFASAFFRNESEYRVDFSSLRRKISKSFSKKIGFPKKAYYFGSKYSEAKILSLDYEMKFISEVKSYYAERSLPLVYCAHRDEAPEKLKMIESSIGVEVEVPDLPAEIYILEHHHEVAEIAAAYSSVINNLKLVVPDKKITSFRLKNSEISMERRESVMEFYRFFEAAGVIIHDFD